MSHVWSPVEVSSNNSFRRTFSENSFLNTLTHPRKRMAFWVLSIPLSSGCSASCASSQLEEPHLAYLQRNLYLKVPIYRVSHWHPRSQWNRYAPLIKLDRALRGASRYSDLFLTATQSRNCDPEIWVHRWHTEGFPMSSCRLHMTSQYTTRLRSESSRACRAKNSVSALRRLKLLVLGSGIF